MKLGINIDHVATLRNARGGNEPDVLKAMRIAIAAGCDSIVCHLRVDRRHIKDEDVYAIRKECSVPMNLEASLEQEIIDIALKVKPEIITIVPERRQEITTEGGLDVIKKMDRLKEVVPLLKEKNITVSLFIAPDKEMIDATKECGATSVEIHTGHYSNLSGDERDKELERLIEACDYSKEIGLFVAAGHGLNYENTSAILDIKSIEELNIGHSVVSRSIFTGFEKAVKDMISLVKGGK